MNKYERFFNSAVSGVEPVQKEEDVPAEILKKYERFFNSAVSGGEPVQEEENVPVDTEQQTPIQRDIRSYEEFFNKAVNKEPDSNAFVIDPGITTVQESQDVDDEEEEPFNEQNSLYAYYSNKHPELFSIDGTLVDVEGAEDLGIIERRGRATVPLTDEPTEDLGPSIPHYSTDYLSDQMSALMYTTPKESIKLSEQHRRQNLSRHEKLAIRQQIEEDKVNLQAKKLGMSRDEYLEQEVIPNLQKDVPVKERTLTSYVLQYANSIGVGAATYEALYGLGELGAYVAEGVTDKFENALIKLRDENPETFDKVFDATPETLAPKLTGDLASMLLMTEGVTGMGFIPKHVQHLAGKNADQIGRNLQLEAVRRDRARTLIRIELRDRKLDPASATFNKVELEKQRIQAAKDRAKENRELKNTLIKELEEREGITISNVNRLGNYEIDPEKVRAAAKEKLKEIDQLDKLSLREVVFGEKNRPELATGSSDLIEPVLQPDKLDGIVAAASDLKQKYPDAFKGKGTVIDKLFKLTVEKELLPTEELIDTLNKYNLSFEDYVLTVVGSGSTSGKILQKLSQISRLRPKSEAVLRREKQYAEQANDLRKYIMRIENIRRGGLVSQLATAARNLTSTYIRGPLEGLQNMMDTAIYNMQREGMGKGLISLVSPENFTDSFRHMDYILRRPSQRKDVADYVDHILKNKQLDKQYELMFNNLNEIQKYTGRGSGGAIDNVLSELEDAVDFLNTPNRWQEFMIRRGVFLAEMERLVKREYGVDLIKELNKGKLRDFLNDASSVRPEGARSFIDIAADATTKALDITYAKQPETTLFRETAAFIVRNGLTALPPLTFPRFMFNSMELMGNYVGGASLPLLRKSTSFLTKGKIGKGPLTAKDRQRISRNLVGFAAIYGMYQYRTSEDAPAEYEYLKADDDTIIDMTPQYPLRQISYLGEALKQYMRGTLDNWFNGREFLETFLGSNLRIGMGQDIMQDMVDIIDGSDLTAGERRGKAAGELLGNYISSYLVPLAQIIDTQRGLGLRGAEYKETSEDPELDGFSAFVSGFKKPFISRGYFMTPEEEEELPNKEYLFQDSRERKNLMYKVIGGLSFYSADNEEGEYIKKLGINEYDLASKSIVPSIRNAENRYLREVVPEIVMAAREYEFDLRKDYDKESESVKKELTESEYVEDRVRSLIIQQVKNFKSKMLSDFEKGKGMLAKRPAYMIAMLKYRRLPKDIRKAAYSQYIHEFKKIPNTTSTEDLSALLEVANTIKDAYSGKKKD